MTEKEMWKAFCKESGNDTDNYEAWAFGDDADRLASLVLEGKKRATASVYELYAYDNEELPEVGDGDLSVVQIRDPGPDGPFLLGPFVQIGTEVLGGIYQCTEIVQEEDNGIIVGKSIFQL